MHDDSRSRVARDEDSDEPRAGGIHQPGDPFRVPSASYRTIRQLTWDDVHEGSLRIATENRGISFVYGISRDGLIPATIISHFLNIPLGILTIHGEERWVGNSHPWKHEGVVLVIDDVWRTGQTFHKALLRVEADYVATAVLYVDYDRRSFVTSYAFSDPGVWYMSPWERVEPFTTTYATS